ncbi:MAG: glycosyltransferase family 4 protein [Agriterribacter sp.]
MSKPKLFRITTVPVSLSGLLKNQLKYMNQYYEVHAVSSPGDEFEAVKKSEGVLIHEVYMTRIISPFQDLKALIKLIRLIKRERPLIVHTHTPKAGTLGMLAAKLSGVPLRLHTVAGLPLLEIKGFKRKILNMVEKITYSCATKVYPNSFNLKEIIIADRLCKASKLKVIGNGSSNGIDTTHFSPESISTTVKAALKDKIGIKENDIVFCFIGRLVNDKGIKELIEAFIINAEKYQTIKLIIVGNPEKGIDPVDEKTQHIISTHPRIYSAGFQADVRPFLAISDIFVFPSYREGFPNVVLQAGAMGVPSIVSNINGCNEIIENNINGLIVPVKSAEAVADAMNFLITDKDTRLKMAANCRNMIVCRYDQKYMWEQILIEYKNQININNF